MSDNLFTEEELKEMQEFLLGITDYIPEAKGPYVWDMYKKISGSNENRPCYCGSSANLWRKAITTMRDYVKEQNEKGIVAQNDNA